MTMSKADAGRRGGKTTLKRYGKRYMKRLAKWGAHRMHAKYKLEPYGQSDFALVDRKTNEVKALLSGRAI